MLMPLIMKHQHHPNDFGGGDILLYLSMGLKKLGL